MIRSARSRARGRAARRIAAIGVRALATLAAAAIGVTLAPPDAQALRVSEAQAVTARVIADAKRDAAKARVSAAPRNGTEEQTRDAPAEPLAEAELREGSPQRLVAEAPGVVAEFSGHEIGGSLDLSLQAAGGAVEASAASETGGEVIGTAVEITATAQDGSETTDFPAEVRTEADEHGVESTVEITPGIALGFDVDAAAVEAAGLDPATLRIYTREADDDPWLELPSYFDADAGRVVGESDHLSAFVVIGQKFTPPPGPRIVLDPDDDYGWAETPAPASELSYNTALANLAAAKLSQACLAQVVVTRQADVRFVSGETRAAIAASLNPVATVTIAFDALTGSAWGTESDGGTHLYSRGGAGDALAVALVDAMPSYTGRPAGTRAANAIFPDPAFAGVPGAMAHMETLYLDHNYDRAVIDNGFEQVVNGAVVGIARYVESLGYDCSDPALGGLPSPPSQAELERWRHLGHQNYQTYGADPVSFSTGNLVEDEPLFALSGPGDQELDFTLTYNSQDGRLSRAGAGWSFGLGGRAQRFDDGSVRVVRGDGASFVFAADGAGGYSGEPGLGLTLREAGAGILEMRSDTGERWRYDAADIEGIGELISHADRQGRTTTLSYGTADEDVHQFVPLASVTDAAGQTVTVESDAVGRIAALVHPDGRRWRLGYDAAGDLVAITGPDGGVRGFAYDEQHRMLTATDALGVQYLKNEYDAQGRVVKQWDSDGNLRSFAYGDGETRYTDNEGEVSVFSWDRRRRITRVEDAAGGITRFSFDAADRVTRAIAPDGGVTRYAYDAHGNVSRETRPDGGVWTFTWTAAGELLSQTDPLGRTTTHEVNGAGLTTRTIRPDGSAIDYAYTAAGDLASVTYPSDATERFSYDDRGNLTSWVSAAGRRTVYAYDAANRLISETDAMGGTTAYVYDTADNLLSTTDELGRTTAYTYNRNGQLLTETAPDGGVTAYEWDDLFRVVRATDPEGGVSKYAYNTEDALVGETDALGSTTEYRVDPVGRITRVTDPLGGAWGAELDEAGRVTGETDPLGRTDRRAYDPIGRLISETDAAGGTWAYEYDAVGNLVREVDPEGGATVYRYDELDRLEEVVDPDGRTTGYAYDADDHLVAVIDPVGETTGLTVDEDGLVLTATNALGETTSLEYDMVGRVTAQVGPLDSRTEFAYDAAGQLTAMRDAEGGETRFEYDAAGRETAVVDPAGGRTETRYDRAGRVVATVDAGGDATDYGYDAAGRQTSTRDPDGRETRYGYDAAGQLVRVEQGRGDVRAVTSYEYTAAGELATIVDPRGGRTRYEYDDAGRPITHVDAAGVVNALVYDAAGRVTAERNGAGQTRRLSYTPAGLLVASSDPGGEASFEYDGAGRMIAMQDAQGATAWRYDRLGRAVSETSPRGDQTRIAYDAGGRMEQMTLPDGRRIDYGYDRLGRMTTQRAPWGDLAYEWRADSALTAIVRGGGVRTDIVSDSEQQPVQITHSEPWRRALAGSVDERVAASDEHEGTAARDREPVLPSRTPVACAAGGAGAYLGARELQNLEEEGQCVTTPDYLERRTLPAPDDPVEDGGALRYRYGYTPAGQVASSTREILGLAGDERSGVTAVPETGPEYRVLDSLTRSFEYDLLGRLSRATVSDTAPQGVTAGRSPEREDGDAGSVLAETDFAYDAAGNRTLLRTAAPGGATEIAQEFGGGNRLTKRTVSGDGATPGVREYSYDAAGRRVAERGAGDAYSYEYGFGNAPTRVEAGDRVTETGYDGLGRAVSQTVSTPFGGDESSLSYLGRVQVQRESSAHGAETTIWGALGEVAGIATDTDDETRWALLDRLGSVVAEATGYDGVDISQLADYSEYGVPGFESSGYAQAHGFTGQWQDGATGTVSFGSRSYDASAGTWLAPDAWPGLLTAPASLNRYAYVLGDPVTLADLGGFRPARPQPVASARWTNPSALANHVDRPAYGRSTRVNPRTMNPSALLNHVDKPSYFAATGRYLYTPESMSQQFLQERHLAAVRKCVAARGMLVYSSCAPFIGDAFSEIRKWAKSEAGRDTSFWLATASWLLPVIGAATKTPHVAAALTLVGYLASIASTVIDCVAEFMSPSCMVGIIGAASGSMGSILTRLPKHAYVSSVVLRNTLQAFGIHSTALNYIASLGDWWHRRVV